MRRRSCLKVFIPPSPILFGWSWLDTWYYGVRYARGCHPNDLWTTYFTSSKYVKVFREKNGDPDVIEVRQTFPTDTLAREWEYKVLRRLNAIHNERWLNKTDNKSIPPPYGNTWNKGKIKTEETLKKMRLANLGKSLSEKTKQKLRKPKSEETRKKMSNAKKRQETRLL